MKFPTRKKEVEFEMKPEDTLDSIKSINVVNNFSLLDGEIFRSQYFFRSMLLDIRIMDV